MLAGLLEGVGMTGRDAPSAVLCQCRPGAQLYGGMAGNTSKCHVLLEVE